MNPEVLATNVLNLLRGICWHPESSKGGWTQDGKWVRITFEPDPRDFRFCMGDHARCIKGLQHVASSISRQYGNYEAVISLIQNYSGNGEKEEHEFAQDPAFDHSKITDTSAGLLASAFGRPVHLRVNRQNDKLELLTKTDNQREAAILKALGEVLYAYGYRNGIIIKLAEA